MISEKPYRLHITYKHRPFVSHHKTRPGQSKGKAKKNTSHMHLRERLTAFILRIAYIKNKLLVIPENLPAFILSTAYIKRQSVLP